LITKLIEGNNAPGKNKIKWHPKNISPGVYFYQLKSGNNSYIGRILLL